MNPSYLQIGNELLSNALLDTVTVTQELNRHWRLEVRFRQTMDKRPPYESYLRKPCRLFSYDENGAEVTLFEGVVKESELDYLIYGNYGGWLMALSYSHFMEFAPRVACYTTSSLPVLATEIAGLTGLSASVQASGQTATKQYVQWGETDFHFLHRICDDHKAWLRPTAKGVEIFDRFQAGVPLAFREEYGLLSFDVEGELGSPSMDGAHYDPKPMASQTYRQVSQQPSFTGASGRLTNALLQASQQMPPGYVYDRSRAPSLADYEARLKLESERALGSRITAHGISRELRVKAGNKVEIGGAIDAAGTYGVTKVIHRWTLNGYENEFWCTPWVHWMEREPPARKKWHGVVPARVVQQDEAAVSSEPKIQGGDPEHMGWHRIRYFWQEEGEPMLWARMMTPHAGQNRGWFFQPEIGDEVVVAFEDGDPERPLILGCVWNGVDTAPTADFWGGEYADNDVKRIVTKSGNRIQFVDKPGKQAIQLATPRNLKISMYEKANETGRPMLHISNLNGDIMTNAPNGRIHFQSKLFSREVGGGGASSNGAMPAAHLVPVSAPAPPKPSSAPTPPVAKPSAPTTSKKNPCAAAKEQDQQLTRDALARAEKMWRSAGYTDGLPDGWEMPFADGEFSCMNQAAMMRATAARFNKYSQALPYARAAQETNELGDKPASQAKAKPCLTLLPDSGAGLSKALGLPEKTITDRNLKQTNNGFRASMYRSDSDGTLILVARDTEPHSLEDWRTNIDNGAGKDTNQYQAMRNLTNILRTSDVPFDLAGYSKGGGLAQEAGLISKRSQVYVFNSAGLSDASLRRTGNSSFDSLASRTQSYSSQGDFLTMMNNTTDPQQQIADAQFLRDQLAGGGLINPISLDYRNPDTLQGLQDQQFAQQQLNAVVAAGGIPSQDLIAQATRVADPAFEQDRQMYLKSLDQMIAKAKADAAADRSFQLFPPVRANSQEAVPNSMSLEGSVLGAQNPGPNLGHLAQHQISNVVGPMEKQVQQDREAMKKFLENCGG